MHLTGVLAPLPTPFNETGELDIRRLRAAVPHWLKSPLLGFVVLGTNGEAGLIDDVEAERVIGETRALVPAGRTLIAGTARESTAHAVVAAKRAGALGADAVLVRTPCFFKGHMSAVAFERHYTAVADGSPVPVLLYNFTAATGVNLQPDVVGRLAEHPNIVGIKESGSDIAQIADLVAVAPQGFAVLAGSASTFCAALCAGVSGGILALVRRWLQMPAYAFFELVRAGNYDAARDLQRQVLPLARLISTGYGVPGLKAALALSGIDAGLPRLPLAPAPDAAVAALRTALNTLEDAFGHDPRAMTPRWQRWAAAALAAALAWVAYAYFTLPDVRPLATTNPSTTAFMDLRAREARAARKTPRHDQRWIAYRRISPTLTRAVLVAEDAAFWQHEGVDYDELTKSIELDWARGQLTRGASTITQQLAKNLYLSPSRNPLRKFRELIIARRLEAELTKTRIFELYLNVIEFGDGIYGAEAASQVYFQRSAGSLDAAQSALLAGSIINPRVLNPGKPTPRLTRRQQMILGRMGQTTHHGALPEDDLSPDGATVPK